MKISQLIKYLTERLEKYGDSEIDVEVGGDSKLPLPETPEQAQRRQIEETMKKLEEIKAKRDAEEEDKLKPYRNVFDDVFPDDWDTKNPWKGNSTNAPAPKLIEWWKKSVSKGNQTSFQKEYENLYQGIFSDPDIKDLKITVDPKILKKYISDILPS